MKAISVIIVNYKTPELVRACVESVLTQREIDFEVIVADNASGDESVSVLKTFGDRIILIENKENLGFGKANNQAFQKSSGRYIFLLNPDARLLNDLDLKNAVNFMENHPSIGLAGTRIVDSEGVLQETLSDHYPRQKQCSMDFSALPGHWACVLGASMVMSREAFQTVNGFDEDFFLYAEETDLCLRLRKAGYEIGSLDSVTVSHVGGASAKHFPSKEVIRRKKSAKYLFYQKHYPKKDVLAMAKKDYRNALWRSWFLNLKKKCMGLTKKEEHQLTRHEVTQNILSQLIIGL